MKKLTVLLICFVVTGGARASVAYRDGFIIGGWEDDFGLKLNGRIQARYQYESPSDSEDLSSFYLRRVRLDFRGYVFERSLSFRIMPDLSGSPNLRDGWINYEFEPLLNIRAGQMTAPFQRQRSVSTTRQHFAERGLPSEAFGFPGGYDIGVMLHGAGRERKWTYAVGIFDGYGRNRKESNSAGNLLSARFARALLGRVASAESDLPRSPAPELTVGTGVQGATKNQVRNWALGRADDDRADFLAATADIYLAWMGFSAGFDYYLRRVWPEAAGDYTGDGFLVTAGYVFPGSRLELVGRYSELSLDRKDNDTREKEIGGGLNIYLQGNNLKTRINYFRQEDAGISTDIFLGELHLSF